MDISEYSKNSRVPLKTLRWMVQEKMIEDPLSKKDLIGLALLEKLWMRRDYLRPQLSQFSRKRRQEFLDKVDLETKWERYAYSRFINLPPGERLRMKKLIEEIEITFDFGLNYHQVKRLYTIRKKVYNKRKASKIAT